MSEREVPPEDPDTAPDELLPDASPEERTRDASEHAGKKARADEEAERGTDKPPLG
jgi:hypothetical protein